MILITHSIFLFSYSLERLDTLPLILPHRSSHQREVFCKKRCSQKFRKIHRKHLCRPATLLKKRLWHKCFHVNFAKFLRTAFLQSTSGRLILTAKKTYYKLYLKKTSSIGQNLFFRPLPPIDVLETLQSIYDRAYLRKLVVPFIIFLKTFIIDVWQGPKHATATNLTLSIQMIAKWLSFFSAFI